MNKKSKVKEQNGSNVSSMCDKKMVTKTQKLLKIDRREPS